MRMEVLLCAPDCTSDYVNFNGHCYKSFEDLYTRGEARQACAADGGVLAVPEDSATNSFLASLQPVTGGRWLGLTDQDGDGQFVFEDGRILTSYHYSNWQPNDDANGAGCVAFWMTLSTWDPRGCNYLRGFICQIAVTTTTPNVTTTPFVTTTTPVTTTAPVVTTTMSVSTTTITTSGAANIVTTAMSGEASLTTSRPGEGGSAAANKGEARGGAVAGGVVGAIMAVAGAGLAVGGFLMYMKKKKNNAAVEPAPSNNMISWH
ncbi:hypothetical protein Bbelb_082970 [Branchiostoma belcheri]|nr:hypothetical protein Bbelb_082970 [Branchiostoma belcheri]